MIPFQGAIWMAPEPADMRKSIDGLSHQVRASLGHNPRAGDAFLFRNRAGNRIKIVVWDGTGLWTANIGRIICHSSSLILSRFAMVERLSPSQQPRLKSTEPSGLDVYLAHSNSLDDKRYRIAT